MNVVLVFQILVISFAVVFSIVLITDLVDHKDDLKGKGWINLSIAGVVTQFFDTLGIGSYGTLTAWFKITKVVPDKKIPGTLNTCTVVTCAFMTVAYTTTIEVEIATLLVPVITSTIGSFVGASVISKLPVNKIRYGMAIALIAVAAIMVLRQLEIFPVGGDAIGLSAGKLVVVGIISLILGALMTIGVGIYAPMMALVFLMGLSPDVAYPIMMGSCAFLIPTAGIKFIMASRKTGEAKYDRKTAVCVNYIGCIGVAIAVFVVTSIPMDVLKWVVVAVLTYTSIMLIVDARKEVAGTIQQDA